MPTKERIAGSWSLTSINRGDCESQQRIPRPPREICSRKIPRWFMYPLWHQSEVFKYSVVNDPALVSTVYPPAHRRDNRFAAVGGHVLIIAHLSCIVNAFYSYCCHCTPLHIEPYWRNQQICFFFHDPANNRCLSMYFIRFSQVILGGWLMHCFKAVPPNHSRSQCDGRCIYMHIYAYLIEYSCIFKCPLCHYWLVK